MLRTRLVGPLAAVSALVALASPGTASAAPGSSSFGVSTTVPRAAKPNSNIGDEPISYTPSSLTAKRSGTTPSTCTPDKVAFTITNTTTTRRTVTVDGQQLAQLRPKQSSGICVFTDSAGSVTFALKKHPKVTLVVHIT